MSTPRIAAIHDLSCFGRCSLTIALPVLSAMGCQCCPLPTALLSAHTGFPGNTFLDLTAEMGRIADHWTAMDLQFDAIYSGFLGSADQVDTVARFFDTFKKSDTAVIVDPVMGDHGTAYRTCTPELCRGMRVLAENSDVITPNLTEAALLLGLAVCAAAGALLLRGLADVLDMLEDLAAAGGLPPELLAPLVKTPGIALVSRLGTEICRDAGQGAMAALLETAGAFGAVLVSLPLVRAAWELLRSLV